MLQTKISEQVKRREGGININVNIGGNYFTDFQFMGGRGYEAVGYLGAIIGTIIGMLLGILLGIKLSGKMEKDK